MLRRRRELKTDYVQRFALLKSDKPRLVIRRSLNNYHVQVIAFEELHDARGASSGGDKTKIDVFSRHLAKHGWKGHGGNISSAYLTGFLAGAMALKQGIKEANVDIGLQMSVRGSGLFAAAAGARDAGLSVSIGKEAVPNMDRIEGKHVADYAAKIKGSDAYKKQFSSYLKNGVSPEDLPKHFDEVKAKIAAEFNVKTKKEVEA